jgi:hypothetical protein
MAFGFMQAIIFDSISPWLQIKITCWLVSTAGIFGSVCGDS